jgi:hypothetical protein
MRAKLPEVSSRFGAPMGRKNTFPSNRAIAIKLRLIRLRWVDGDYDEGGAYWGNPGRSFIYWAFGGETSVFVRAGKRAEAKGKVLGQLPNARFYR